MSPHKANFEAGLQCQGGPISSCLFSQLHIYTLIVEKAHASLTLEIEPRSIKTRSKTQLGKVDLRTNNTSICPR